MIKNAKYSVGNDLFPKSLSEMLYIIWYHWHNLKNVKNTQEGVTFSKVAGFNLKLY